MEKPKVKSILDPTFNYVPSAQTDLRKTFARIRKEIAKAKMEETHKEKVAVISLVEHKKTLK